jgi:hypothetical protein
MPGLGQAQTNYQPAPRPGVDRFTRNLSDQFRQPGVGEAIERHSNSLEVAQHFRSAGLGAALHYTLTGHVPYGLRETQRRRMRALNQPTRGIDPEDVQVSTPQQDWVRQSREARRNQRLKNAWGDPAPSEEQTAEDDWMEGHQAQARRQNRAAYVRNMGTPTRRPPDVSGTGGTSDLKQHIESMQRPKPDNSDLRRWTP